MMRVGIVLLISALPVSALLVGTALAQDTDRYSMEKTAQGYVRLDKQTGQMSLCKENGAQLVCQLAADDRDALQDELGRLREQLAAVDKRVTALESGGGQSPKSVPTEEEFNQTMSYMQRFFRGFLDIVKEFDRDLRGPESPGPGPDRT